MQPYVFVHIACAVRATAWLTVGYWLVSNLQCSMFMQNPFTNVYTHLDIVFDNDIDTGVMVWKQGLLNSGCSWWNWPIGLRNFISGWTYGIVVVALAVFIISGVFCHSSSPNLNKLAIFSCPYSYIENIHFSLMKPNAKA